MNAGNEMAFFLKRIHKLKHVLFNLLNAYVDVDKYLFICYILQHINMENDLFSNFGFGNLYLFAFAVHQIIVYLKIYLDVWGKAAILLVLLLLLLLFFG